MKNRLVNLRQTADEAMKNVNVTQELKQRVLNRCIRKRKVPVARLVAMAACGALIFGILNFSGVLRPGNQPNGQEILGTQGVQDANGTQDGLSYPEAGIFSAAAEQTDPAQGQSDLAPEQTDHTPGQSDTSIPNEPAVVTDWLLNTPQAAGQSFGSAFLTPSYIPKGFQPDSIIASGSESMIAYKIILSYIAKERTFIIIEEKIPETDTSLDDEAIDIDEVIDVNEVIDINGMEGFMKVGPSDSEVYWFKDGVYYCVSGQITGEEAIKVARAMR